MTHSSVQNTVLNLDVKNYTKNPKNAVFLTDYDNKGIAATRQLWPAKAKKCKLKRNKTQLTQQRAYLH